MSIVASRDIRPDDEVLVGYNYEMSHAPRWYQELWFKHLRDELDWTEEQIEAWCEKETAKTGYKIEYTY